MHFALNHEVQTVPSKPRAGLTPRRSPAAWARGSPDSSRQQTRCCPANTRTALAQLSNIRTAAAQLSNIRTAAAQLSPVETDSPPAARPQNRGRQTRFSIRPFDRPHGLACRWWPDTSVRPARWPDTSRSAPLGASPMATQSRRDSESRRRRHVRPACPAATDTAAEVLQC